MTWAGNITIGCCYILSSIGKGPIKEIPQGFVGQLTRFGKYEKKVGPGLYTFNPFTERFKLIDMRAILLDIPEQALLTKDNVTIYLDGYVNYKVSIPEKAAYNVQDYSRLVLFMTQGVLKTIVSEHTLQDLLSNRKVIEKKQTDIIDEKMCEYGIHVISIETQAIRLPAQMERAMATVAESVKCSEAKVINAMGDLDASKIFKEAADELGKNKISLQLQYFECLKSIAVNNNSTIIVPDSIIGKLGEGP